MKENFEDFHYDLVAFLVNLNIPLSKINNHFLKGFFKKHIESF